VVETSEEGQLSIQESIEVLGRASAWSREVGRCCPAWWPRTHYVEHVVGDEQGMVSDAFGLDLGQIRIWAEYKDRIPHEALHFS
jgi:hypothetical protein